MVSPTAKASSPVWHGTRNLFMPAIAAGSSNCDPARNNTTFSVTPVSTAAIGTRVTGYFLNDAIMPVRSGGRSGEYVLHRG